MKLDPPDHWRRFLKAVDGKLEEPVHLHCLGGFVVEVVYGVPRRTGDLDYINASPPGAAHTLEAIAGRQSELAETYGLHLQYVTVEECPEDYESRLVTLDLGMSRLQISILEPYDLILSKLTRNHAKDREDVKALVESQQLSYERLEHRYEQELRPYLAKPETHDLTLSLWKEFF